MAQMAAVSHWSRARAWSRAVRRCLGRPPCVAAGLFLVALLASGGCVEQPVPGEDTLAVSRRYTPLLLKLDEDVESEVSVAGTILVIRFKRPVDVAVAKLSDAAPDY